MFPLYKWTLRSYFEPKWSSPSSDLPNEREILLLLVQLCAGLVHLQRHHVCHRDVKVSPCSLASCGMKQVLALTATVPTQIDNIFMNAHGEVKFADFGEVRATNRCAVLTQR